jgi:mannose-1-phosphate guanylyltransferase/mannose-6-phosphate isomerase
LVGAIGVANIIVIDTPDALLIATATRSQEVKHLVQELKQRGHKAHQSHHTVTRPWGTYCVIEEGLHYKIKRLVVRPGASLSLQLHQHRSEHWIVVSGTAKVRNDDCNFILSANQSTFIPAGHKHRLSNPEANELIMIEVQSGEYLGEDDIIRFDVV